MEETLSAMSEIKEPKIPKVSRKSNGFSRADVVSAFQSAFEIIGGVDRLSLWANANPDKFYPLYSKLLPATTQIIGNPGVLEIIHRLAPTALDAHPTHLIIDMELESECQQSSSGTTPDSISVPSMDAINDGQFLSPTDEPERP